MSAPNHGDTVDAWLAQFAQASPGELLLVLDAALGTLWRRTRSTLGEITMTAIFDRVLYNASEKFAFCGLLEVAASDGVRTRRLLEHPGPLEAAELLRGMRHLVVEFLTVLGNLTAQILTPALHSALTDVSLEDAVPTTKQPRAAAPIRSPTKAEDTPS